MSARFARQASTTSTTSSSTMVSTRNPRSSRTVVKTSATGHGRLTVKREWTKMLHSLPTRKPVPQKKCNPKKLWSRRKCWKSQSGSVPLPKNKNHASQWTSVLFLKRKGVFGFPNALDPLTNRGLPELSLISQVLRENMLT